MYKKSSKLLRAAAAELWDVKTAPDEIDVGLWKPLSPSNANINSVLFESASSSHALYISSCH